MSKLSSKFKSKWFIGILIVLVLLVGGYFLTHKAKKYQYIPVQRGSVTEAVSITGNTTPTQSVSLAFGSSGVISNVHSDIGEKVQAGQILAELNMKDLIAQLHQAQASVDQQQAKLNSLQSSSQPADAGAALIVAMRNSYLQIESAVLKYTDTIFNNGVSVNPTIQVMTQDQNEKQNIDTERLMIGEQLKKWKDSLSNLGPSSTATDINNALVIAKDTIVSALDFTDNLGTITGRLNTTDSGLTQSAIDTDRSNINTAGQLVSSGASSLQGASDAWNSAPQDIDAQTASVKSAQASVESAEAKIQNAQIIAPISGTITQFDAKVGQLASPSTSLISIISDAGYEVDAGVSETDIGKIAVDNTVSMTLDAFPGETFSGKVFYIAPSETNTQGVVSYQVKISFDKIDDRLKSGLTANIDIETKHKDDVLVLPQYAVLQNDQGTFVETLENNTVKQNPVTLGIQDQKGNVEIISGVTEGEQVLNIGLKTQ